MTPQHLYIHVPFCARRCAYCDFAIAVRRIVPVDEYLDALAIELGNVVAGSADLQTVYLGGGTPSRLGARGIEGLLRLVRERFTVTSGAEITVEANPEDVTDTGSAEWAAAGVNRVSLGVQSFDDSVLGWMHRTHTGQQAVAAVESLRRAGIENVSVDLIFALPAELGRSWRTDLRRALDLDVEHISLYGLTVERGTPLARWQARGAAVPADDDFYADEFLLAHDMMLAAGYRHYEVSNFARPGLEARHNSAYWAGVPYLGVGPSAHSFDGETRRWNVRHYADWRQRLESGMSVVEGAERLAMPNRLAEKVYLGLRTDRGLVAAGPDLDRARSWMDSGWARIEGDVVRLTPEGWLRLDSLAAGLTGL